MLIEKLNIGCQETDGKENKISTESEKMTDTKDTPMENDQSENDIANEKEKETDELSLETNTISSNEEAST